MYVHAYTKCSMWIFHATTRDVSCRNFNAIIVKRTNSLKHKCFLSIMYWNKSNEYIISIFIFQTIYVWYDDIFESFKYLLLYLFYYIFSSSWYLLYYCFIFYCISNTSLSFIIYPKYCIIFFILCSDTYKLNFSLIFKRFQIFSFYLKFDISK